MSTPPSRPTPEQPTASDVSETSDTEPGVALPSTAQPPRGRKDATAVIGTTDRGARRRARRASARPNTGRSSVLLAPLPGEEPFDEGAALPDGDYLLGAELGRGGMGRVVSAHDTLVGRTVALKTLHAAAKQDPSMERALIFEARLSGQLEHPNIVPVHAMGRLRDGTPFYTMKRVGTTSLHDVLQALRAGEAEATETYRLPKLLGIFRGICLAAEYAHARGVVHRDLKPENVMIGAYGEVQILDWGVARILPQGPGEPGLFAGSPEPDGLIVGTPHYMSPEQARGDNRGTGPASDIFALGLILYEILTLRLPFDHADGEAHIHALLHEPLPPPSARAGDRDVPPELERVVLRALAPSPADRYPSARALWEDVEAFLEGRREAERLARLAAAQDVLAQAATERFHRLRGVLREAEEALRRDERDAGSFDSLDDRKARWARHLDVEHLRLGVARALAEAVAACQQTLAHVPGHRAARQRLRALYLTQARDAHDRGDDASMILYGELATAAAGPGGPAASATLHVRSFPEGASLALYELRDHEALAPERARALGTAPCHGVRLRPGAYLVSATLQGCRETRQPVLLSDGEEQHLLITLRPWAAEQPHTGRADEARAIEESFQRCLAEQRLTVTLVLGADGMGKGQLCVHFDDYLDQLPEVVSFVYARCSPLHRRVPFRAAAEILRHRAGVGRDDAPDVVRDKLHGAVLEAFRAARGAPHADDLPRAERDHARRVADLMGTLPGLRANPLPGTPVSEPHAATREVFEAIATYFERLLDVRPLAVTIRGIDHLDRLTRDLLAYLMRRLRHRPVFVLGTARANDLRLDADRVITLEPLRALSANHLLSSLLGGPADEELSTAVAALTDGNPSHITEVARVLRRLEAVRWDGRRWSLGPLGRELLLAPAPAERVTRAESPHVTLPRPSVAATLVAPLEAAAPPRGGEALEVARHAALCGPIFWAGEVAERRGRDPSGALAQLVDADLVTPLRSSRVPGEREFAFRSEALMEALAAATPSKERAQAHQAIARWLAARSRGTLREHARVAFHLALAGASARALALHEAPLAAEARRWEGADGPAWSAWPRDLSSALPLDAWARARAQGAGAQAADDREAPDTPETPETGGAP